MLVEFKLNKYYQLLNARPGQVKWTCSCPDFIFRQLEKKGKCKHLKEIESRLDKKWLNKILKDSI